MGNRCDVSLCQFVLATLVALILAIGSGCTAKSASQAIRTPKVKLRPPAGNPPTQDEEEDEEEEVAGGGGVGVIGGGGGMGNVGAITTQAIATITAGVNDAIVDYNSCTLSLAGKEFFPASPSSYPTVALRIPPPNGALPGGTVYVANEHGSREPINYASNIIMVPGWGNLRATVSADGNTINWANDSIWTRSPTQGSVNVQSLTGTWYMMGNSSLPASVNSSTNTVTNELGQAVGFTYSANTLTVPGWAYLNGLVSANGNTINWANSDYWTRSPIQGQSSIQSLIGEWYMLGNVNSPTAVFGAIPNINLQVGYSLNGVTVTDLNFGVIPGSTPNLTVGHQKLNGELTLTLRDSLGYYYHFEYAIRVAVKTEAFGSTTKTRVVNCQ